MRFLLITLLTINFAVAAQEITFYGNATDLDTGEPLYQEIHKLVIDDQGNPVSETVRYVSPDGVELGIKTLDYQNLSSPNYQATYRYLPVSETVIKQASSLKIDRGETTVLSLPTTDYAIDGGFHFHMLKNFDELIKEKTVRFDFLSAGRADFIPLKATASSENNALTIKLTLDNFFLSKLVKPIELVYDVKTRNLLSYRGLTNVPNENGKLYYAQIDYLYPADYAQNSYTAALEGRL
jgi:hypothetical protein